MKILSLFSGPGGLDLGLIKAGHEIVYATDFDKDCQLTYEYNIGKHFHLEDVHDLDTSKLPKFDLLTGGFPCQGFSIANLYRSIEDSRNHLYLQIVRILTETTPKFFLAENVPGILSLGKGRVVKIIIKQFSNVAVKNGFPGYEVRQYLLNAADYGVPQSRKRVIFLGISKEFTETDRSAMFNYFPPPITHSNTNKPDKLSYKTLKDAIGDLPEPETSKGKKIYNHIGNKHKVKINGYIGNRKLNWNKPSPTIVGRGGGTGGPVIAVHPNLKRRFTVRETARIQTFPDDFKFFGSVSSQFRQIGNAVAVNFAYNLGIALNNINNYSNKVHKHKFKDISIS